MTEVANKKKPAPYYKVHVVMKTGFKYKFVCIGRNLESMLKQIGRAHV